MRDNIPDNVFINDQIKAQIREIVSFRDELVEKNKLYFLDESVFINLDFEAFPKEGEEPSKISFIPDYSPNLPEALKDEFERFLIARLRK